jgi:ATP-dependent RNA helicase SUPV3L1/SUV3
MLERLADLIRVLVSWRADPANPALPPKGATGDGGFKATPDMMSILGCSAEELGNVLRALGFWADRRPIPVEPPASAAAVTGAAGETTAQTAEAHAEAAATGMAEAPTEPIVVAANEAANEVHAEAAATGMAEAPAEPIAVAANEVKAEAAATGMAETPAEPIAVVANEPAESLAPTEAATAKEAELVRWEEIWRPRRRGRVVETAHREKRSPAEPGEGPKPHHRPRQQGYQARPEGAKPGQSGDKRRTDRREQRRDGAKPPKPRREERPRVALQASPPGRKAGFDPDSPFAALSALKATMDKRTQE